MPFPCFYSVIKARQKVGLTRNAHCRNTKARTSRNFYSFSVRGLIESRSKHFLSLLLFSDYLKKNTSRKGKGNTTSIWFSKCTFSALLFTFVGVEEFIYIFQSVWITFRSTSFVVAACFVFPHICSFFHARAKQKWQQFLLSVQLKLLRRSKTSKLPCTSLIGTNKVNTIQDKINSFFQTVVQF